jgi:hypothetical protein
MQACGRSLHNSSVQDLHCVHTDFHTLMAEHCSSVLPFNISYSVCQSVSLVLPEHKVVLLSLCVYFNVQKIDKMLNDVCHNFFSHFIFLAHVKNYFHFPSLFAIAGSTFSWVPHCFCWLSHPHVDFLA